MNDDQFDALRDAILRAIREARADTRRDIYDLAGAVGQELGRADAEQGKHAARDEQPGPGWKRMRGFWVSPVVAALVVLAGVRQSARTIAYVAGLSSVATLPALAIMVAPPNSPDSQPAPRPERPYTTQPPSSTPLPERGEPPDTTRRPETPATPTPRTSGPTDTSKTPSRRAVSSPPAGDGGVADRSRVPTDTPVEPTPLPGGGPSDLDPSDTPAAGDGDCLTRIVVVDGVEVRVCV